MSRSNKVTHKMTIIERFTTPPKLWSYIDCVFTLQPWTSHILYEKNFLSKMRCVVELRGEVVCVERRSIMVTVNWWMLEIAPFRCSIGCLYLRHPHTHGHIMYHWKTLFIPVTMKDTAEPSNYYVVHVQWRSNKVTINVSIFKGWVLKIESWTTSFSGYLSRLKKINIQSASPTHQNC